MAPGEAPKTSPEEEKVQSSLKIVTELRAELTEAKKTEGAGKTEKLQQLTKRLEAATKALTDATAARTKKLQEESEARLAAQEAAPKPTEVPVVAPAVAPTVAVPDAPATPATPQPETPPATPVAVAPEATTETPPKELGFLEKAFKNPKVVDWLEKIGLGGIAEALASFFGITIDRVQIQNEKLAEGSNAAINEADLAKLKQLATQPKLAEFKDANDPKDETAPWKHVAGWLGLSGKIGNQADFFAVFSKGKSKIDLGVDKGGMQDVPNFTSFTQVDAKGYRAGDVIIGRNIAGYCIPAIVVDASDASSPVISFVNSQGVLPADKPFESTSLEYQFTGPLNDPKVKKGLDGFAIQRVFRTASLEDQQAWYLAKNPSQPVQPAAPAAAPASAPAVTPVTAPTVAASPAPATVAPVAAPNAPAVAPAVAPATSAAAATSPQPAASTPAPGTKV